MLNKKFKTNKEVKLFKQEYSNGNLPTEVISNILQRFHADQYPEIQPYIDFLWHDSLNGRKLFALKNFSERFSLDILKSLYGKCDFIFTGNRTYKNYVFEFNGLTFITPSKREVIIEAKDWEKHIPTIIEFEKQFQQLLFTHVVADFNNLPDYIQQDITDLKTAGIISQDNQINFNYVKNLTSSTTKKVKIS